MTSPTVDAVLAHDTDVPRCLINPPRQCTVLEFDDAHLPFAFILFPTQWRHQKKNIQKIIQRHVIVQENGAHTPLNLRCFNDFQSIVGNNFCNRICKPIQKSEFCMALCRNNRRNLITKISSLEMTVGKIDLPNENVWWELGISMGFGKKVIVFIGKGQRTPTNFFNNIEVQNLGTPNEIETRLRTIFQNPMNFGNRISWV